MAEADAPVGRPWSDSDEGTQFKRFLAWQEKKQNKEDAADSQADANFLNGTKWRRRKKIAVWALGILSTSCVGAYFKFAPEPAAVVEPKDVKDAVDTRVGALEEAINGCHTEMDTEGKPVECSEEEQKGSIRVTSDMANKKADRLGDLHFDQRGLILDIRGEIIEKLDARTGQEKRDVKVPDSVGVAEEQVEAWRNRKAQEKMRESLSKGDPFADLK